VCTTIIIIITVLKRIIVLRLWIIDCTITFFVLFLQLVRCFWDGHERTIHAIVTGQVIVVGEIRNEIRYSYILFSWRRTWRLRDTISQSNPNRLGKWQRRIFHLCHPGNSSDDNRNASNRQTLTRHKHHASRMYFRVLAISSWLDVNGFRRRGLFATIFQRRQPVSSKTLQESVLLWISGLPRNVPRQLTTVV